MSQPSAFDTILVQSRDLFRDRLCDAIGQMFDDADESLTAASEKLKDEELKVYTAARDIIPDNREVVEKQFRSRYTGDFQKRTNKAKQIGQSLSDFSLDDLELVGDDDLNETLRFNGMAAKVRKYCEEELGALDQRVGVLLGDATLESDDNPFGPQVICDAYKHACRQVECPVEVRKIFLKLFDDHVIDTLRSSYKEVNELLVANSILPKIRFGISKNAEGKATASLDGKKAEDAPATAEDMFARIAKMMGGPAGAGGAGGSPAPGMGVGGVPLVQGQALMGSLTQLQVGDLAALGEAAAELGPILAEAGNLKNVLHQLKGTSVGASMGQMDSMTLNVVAMLFDELFDDPKIPIALKGLIGRLQLPILKVAIADKDLFTEKSHPARQLMDVLGQIGLRLPPEFDAVSPLFPRLETFIQQLVEGFKEKMEIFDQVRAELEAIIAEDDQRVSEAMHATEKQLQQAESLALAKLAAQQEIRSRVEAAGTAPVPVIHFLAQQWLKYLVIAHARHGKESDAWKQALETIDLLLWSVAPKATPEDQRKLAKTVPTLLKGMRTGILEAGIEDEVAKAFMGELIKLHTDVLRPPTPPPPPAPDKARLVGDKTRPVSDRTLPAGDPSKTMPGKAGAPAPARKQLPPPDDVLDFTQPVSVNNPFGEGKVEVSSEDLDFTAVEASAPVAAAPAAGPAASPAGAPGASAPPKPSRPAKDRETAVRLPSAMIVGAWASVVTGDDESRTPAKLHYVSPMKSHFLFVDRQGRKVYECSRSMLARRIKLGEVRLLDGEPDASLFDRIVEGLFGKLKTPVPA
ncbi:MAG: DUF1631 family protein [Usitatibacter sp.]